MLVEELVAKLILLNPEQKVWISDGYQVTELEYVEPNNINEVILGTTFPTDANK